MSQRNEFHVGEIVDVRIEGARIIRSGFDEKYDSPYLSIAIPIGDDEMHGRVHLDAPSITVERVAPAEWPPRPGDIWAGPQNERWFAVKYYGDFDDPQDFKGCNRHGWRVVLMPMQIGPYGDSQKEPDDALRTRGPLTLVHREDGAR